MVTQGNWKRGRARHRQGKQRRPSKNFRRVKKQRGGWIVYWNAGWDGIITVMAEAIFPR